MTSWLVTFLGTVALVVAWWNPSTSVGAALGWTATALFAVALHDPRHRIRRFFLAGVLGYAGGFYWLCGTISDFGGFPALPTFAVFSLYAVVSAFQFVIFAFIRGRAVNWMERSGLALPLSWLIAHEFWIKLFPWDFGHTQLGFLTFAQLAGVTGVSGITFVMFWLVESLCNRKVVSLQARILSVLTFLTALGYGIWVQDSLRLTIAKSPSLSAALIQGNVSLEEKHNKTFFTINREHYLASSALVSKADTLIVWPESVITDSVPSNVSHVTQSRFLPYIGDGSIFLVGALTRQSDFIYHNSSLLIRADGSVDTPYHKIILLPFGEYMPFSQYSRWLRDLNGPFIQLTPGTIPRVMSYTTSTGQEVKLSPLVCYEDILPSLGKTATRLGAQILINQTNDAWFGDSVAPYQHHAIASFRAIENRRYLLRSTNTGLTAVVDPTGKTLAQLLPYTESVLQMEISLLNYRSFYTNMPVELLWTLLAALSTAVLLFSSLHFRQKVL